MNKLNEELEYLKLEKTIQDLLFSELAIFCFQRMLFSECVNRVGNINIDMLDNNASIIFKRLGENLRPRISKHLDIYREYFSKEEGNPPPEEMVGKANEFFKVYMQDLKTGLLNGADFYNINKKGRDFSDKK